MIHIPDQDFFTVKEVIGIFHQMFKICPKTFYNNHRKKMKFDVELSPQDKRITRYDLIVYIKSLKKS